MKIFSNNINNFRIKVVLIKIFRIKVNREVWDLYYSLNKVRIV
jgi:hypothetical protein